MIVPFDPGKSEIPVRYPGRNIIVRYVNLELKGEVLAIGKFEKIIQRCVQRHGFK